MLAPADTAKTQTYYLPVSLTIPQLRHSGALTFWSELDLTWSDSKLHSLSSDCWSQPLEDIGTSEALSSGILELDDKVLEIKEAEIELKLIERKILN